VAWQRSCSCPRLCGERSQTLFYTSSFSPCITRSVALVLIFFASDHNRFPISPVGWNRGAGELENDILLGCQGTLNNVWSSSARFVVFCGVSLRAVEVHLACLFTPGISPTSQSPVLPSNHAFTIGTRQPLHLFFRLDKTSHFNVHAKRSVVISPMIEFRTRDVRGLLKEPSMSAV